MGLKSRRAPFMEFFLNGWTDVTSYVRRTAPVTITRGRSAEQGTVSPATLTATLENPAGIWTPSNPNSQYSGLFGRNTPIRYGIKVANDVFSRTVSSGWGSTDIGGLSVTSDAWTVGPSSGDYNVNSGVGKHFIPTTSTARYSYLAGLIDLQDYEVKVDVSIGVPPVGTVNYGGVLVRGQSSTNAIRVLIVVHNPGGLTLEARDLNTNTLIFSDSIPSLTVTNSLLVGVEGRTLRIKTWDPATSAEPFDWNANIVLSSTFDDIANSGWPGLYSLTGFSSTNATITFDNFSVRLVRFAGEVSTVKPRSDASHKDRRVELEASTAMRRYQQGPTPLLSVMRRGVLRSTGSDRPFAYWPMEEGTGGTALNPAIGTSPMQFQYADGTPFGLQLPKLSADSTFPCSEALPTFSGAAFDVTVPDYTSSNNTVQFRFLMKVPEEGSTASNLTLILFSPEPLGSGAGPPVSTSDISFWELTYDTGSGGQLGLQAWDLGGGNILNDRFHQVNADGTPFLVTINLKQNGANVDWQWTVGRLPIDVDPLSGEATGNSGTVVNRTLDKIRLISGGTYGSSFDIVFGHLRAYTSWTDIFDLLAEYGAYIGEKALDRFIRLCTEEDEPFSYMGEASSTAKMGPQRVTDLLSTLQECADADLPGDLVESRSTGQLTLRTGYTVKGQNAAATLDYSSSHIAPPLEPGSDDQRTRNDITAKRTDGGFYRLERAIGQGPLNTGRPGGSVGSGDSDSVGRYAASIELNVHGDIQLPDIANFLLLQGTIPDERFPRITIILSNSSMAGKAIELQTLGADVDDLMIINNMQEINVYEPVQQLILGYEETIANESLHEIVFITAPYSPYRVGGYDTARYDSETSTLTSSVTSSGTSLSVTTPDSGVWPTTASQPTEFPFDIMIEGERIRVTAATSSSSPQTFTVTRAVNGVNKTHPAGARVAPADIVYYG